MVRLSPDKDLLLALKNKIKKEEKGKKVRRKKEKMKNKSKEEKNRKGTQKSITYE